MSSITKELAIFQPASKEQAIQEVKWVEVGHVGQISKGGTIEFEVSGTSGEYILPAKTQLYVKVRILKSDGNAVDETDDVALTNLSLHSLFRQVDVLLNNKNITASIGVNYPYKAMLDVLLNYGEDTQTSQLQAEGYFEDTSGRMDSVTSNVGYLQRRLLTKHGMAEFQGYLHTDCFQQEKAIVSGVPMTVKLFQHDDSFRLFSQNQAYQLVITEAKLKVCRLKLSPLAILAHNETLKEIPAVYPMWRSDLKTFSIAAGSYQFSTDIFNGLVPSKLFVVFVSSSAYAGDFTKNPFNFQHFRLNYLEVTSDGHSVPTTPFIPQFALNADDPGTYLSTGYAKEFASLVKDRKTCIRREQFSNGFSIFAFDIKSEANKDLFSDLGKGQTRLEVRFESPLSEPVTVIAYGLFPDEFSIDHAKNVIL